MSGPRTTPQLPLLPLPQFTRRGFISGVALAGAVLPGLPAMAQPKPERNKVNVAVGGKAALYHLPLALAVELGFFQAEGLDVTLSDYSGGSTALAAAARGSADVVSGAYEHTIALQSKSQSFQSFVLHGRAPQIALGVSTKAMRNYKTVKDLVGKRIGVSAPGSSTNLVAAMVLLRSGISPSAVKFVGVGTAASALEAIRSGEVDAICNTDPVMTMLEQKGDVTIISDTRTLRGTAQVFGGPMPAGCLYAPAAFVAANPGTCQAMANAVVRSLKWLQTAGPSDLIKAVPAAYLLGDRALYLASFNKIRESIGIDGLLAEEGARTALKAMVSVYPDIKADAIDLDKTYTNQFARRAKEKFKV